MTFAHKRLPNYRWPALLLALSFTACAEGPEPSDTLGDSADFAGLTREQALVELDQFGDAIRAFYAPLEFKTRKFGFDLDAALDAARAETEAGTDDRDFQAALFRLIGGFWDGHMSVSGGIFADGAISFDLPVDVSYVEGHYLVTKIDRAIVAEDAPVAPGDELVSVDGRTPPEIEAAFSEFSAGGTPESRRELRLAKSMTHRSLVTPEQFRPREEIAQVLIRHVDGSEDTLELKWKKGKSTLDALTPDPLPAPTGSTEIALDGAAVPPAIRYGWTGFGTSEPFFMTEQTKAAFAPVEVFPKDATLAELGLSIPVEDRTAPDNKRRILVRAYRYELDGKAILLVRLPSFTSNVPRTAPPAAGDSFTTDVKQDENLEENTKWLAGLLRDHLGDAASGGADVLVVDVTQNGGGKIRFLHSVASLLMPSTYRNVAFAYNPDTMIIAQFLDAARQSMDPAERAAWTERANVIEDAIAAKVTLAPPISAFGTYFHDDKVGHITMEPNKFVQWNKPILMLTNELSASAADALPAIIQRNGRGKTFGARTMGAGGSVDLVATLPHSRLKLNLTRSFFFVPREGALDAIPSDADMVENNGIEPDLPFPVTVDDFRGGFVGYFEAFSRAAISLSN